MKTVCDALGVSRSNMIEQAKSETKKERAESELNLRVVSAIKSVIAERKTYGYRRVTAFLNRRKDEYGLPKLNHKRVYRLMKSQGLLLQVSRKRDSKPHEGKVMTLRSNTRWCSDAFEIRCWNGEKVYCAFSLDCCDREVMSFVAESRPLRSVDIQELMIHSFEQRFGEGTSSLIRLQWLSDNGPIYIAKETKTVGRALGFDIVTTPSYSPESNGMAEAFVKTFKRDYVYVNDVPNAQEVISRISEWMEDYNENAPHKGLGMLTPRQFREQRLGT